MSDSVFYILTDDQEFPTQACLCCSAMLHYNPLFFYMCFYQRILLLQIRNPFCPPVSMLEHIVRKEKELFKLKCITVCHFYSYSLFVTEKI